MGKFNFKMDDYMDNYMKKSTEFVCPSCGQSGMMAAKPDGNGNYRCPFCNGVIRGSIMGNKK